MPDVWLYQGAAAPTDIILSDPTVARGGGAYVLTAILGTIVVAASAADLRCTRLLSALPAVYTVVGYDAVLRGLPLVLTCLAGAVAISGTVASLIAQGWSNVTGKVAELPRAMLNRRKR